jgi:5-methylthioadenosine/S-adenosylhomocysteine deaminase
MASSTSESLITARWIVPVVPAGLVLENHALLIKGSTIQDLLPVDSARKLYPNATRVDLPQHLLTAGLVNTHGHAAMSLLRGYADDRELMDWLSNHIWPVEMKLVDYNFVKDGSTLAVAEMISTGTTCAADTYFFPEAVAEAFTENRFRGQVATPIIQFPNAWAETEDQHIQKGLDFGDSIKDNDLISTAFAPHSPYTVTDKALEAVRLHTEALDLPIHLHLHETKDEVESAVSETGIRPIQRIHELGLISESLQTVHMTQLIEQDFDLLADKGVHLAHCPDSNMKLASGFCPVEKLKEHGVNVAIGTDGAASNNNLDMLEETRSAALLSKVVSADATSVNAFEALAMATINGARLLGLESKIVSLEKGKLADVIAVDLSSINFQPIHHPVSQLIYTTTGHQVSHTWINGELLYANNQFTQLDEARLRVVVEEWRQKIESVS